MRNEQTLRHALDEAIDLVTKFSIPLYVNDACGRPNQFATGFFVSTRQAQFLVSAAHVLDETRKSRVFYYATPTKLRWLTGRIRTTGHPDERHCDPFDVGVMKLTGEYLPPYPEVDKFSIDISYLKPSYVPRSGKHYVIVGFPATKSVVNSQEKTALVSPYAYRSDSIDDKRYAANGVDPETHIVLPLDLRRGLDPAGNIRAFPKPQGMSGAPIVVLYESKEESRIFPVVGIGTTYRKKSKVLIGVDIKFALGAIAQFLEAGI